MTDAPDTLDALSAARWRIAVTLTLSMIAIYFGFIVLIAYHRSLLAVRIAPGLTVGIALGAGVIVASWMLTYGYVRWANEVYDSRLAALARVSDDRAPARPAAELP